MSKRPRDESSAAPGASVVRLNVGGTIYTTTLDTLRAVPDSLFGRMFDPDLSLGMVPTDDDGNIFFDRDPEVFRWVLDFLRRRGRCVGLPRPELIPLLRDEADYFGLVKLVESLEDNGKRIDYQALTTLLSTTEKNLSGCDMRDTDLSWVDFSDANLRGARFDGANLTGAKFIGANLKGATLGTAERTRAQGLFEAFKKSKNTPTEARSAGLTVAEAFAGEYTMREVHQGGYSCAEAKEAGYSWEEVTAAGYLLQEAKAAGYSISCEEAKQAGYSATEAKAAGFTADELKSAGWTLGMTCEEAKAAGYSCAEAKAAGYSPQECSAGGYSYEEGRAAGYGYVESRWNGTMYLTTERRVMWS